MVEAQARVPVPGVAEIIPEGVDRLVRMQRADRVDPALRQQPGVEHADLRREQRVVQPAFGFVDVRLGRHDVEVAEQHHRRAAGDQRLRMRDQRLEPGELVAELRPRPRVAVGEVEPGDEHARHRRLDIAALRRVGIVGQPAARLHRRTDARQKCDAIPARLAVPDRLVTRGGDGGGGELGIRCLQLLQHGDVGLTLGEPAQQHRQATVDAVDVESGDAHAVSLRRGIWRPGTAAASPPRRRRCG